MAGENQIVIGAPSANTVYATIRNTSGEVWYPTISDFETWGTSSRGHSDYAITCTDNEGDMHIADWPSAMPNGNYYLQGWLQIGATPSSDDIAFGSPIAKTWTGSTATPTPTPGLPTGQLTCSEMIDEIQARVGRGSTSAVGIVDDTWCTRRINECQRHLIEQVPRMRSVSFKNTTSLDTTGTTLYAISDITIGDVTDNRACHITDVWYLDGNESRKLDFVPVDEFDALHPDPTHADEHFDRPRIWTQRGNTYVELYPYCASAYWDKNLRFDGDYYPAEFTTNDPSSSDISRADEGIILYGVWKAWQAIGAGNPSVAAEIVAARKAWTNPSPAYGEPVGWFEQFKDKQESMIAWDYNFYAGAT